ncbi:hypothetical protein L1887_04799 [Cichorium endivia]|nr:hypothetical protein L1887_04799 [Cichorium endivia]
MVSITSSSDEYEDEEKFIFQLFCRTFKSRRLKYLCEKFTKCEVDRSPRHRGGVHGVLANGYGVLVQGIQVFYSIDRISHEAGGLLTSSAVVLGISSTPPLN